MDFSGKVALVTGGANGIGEATVRAFAKLGAAVAIVDVDLDAAQSVASSVESAGGKAIAIGADVTKAADVENYVRTTVGSFGRIDCFFNNAGIEGRIAPIVEFDMDIFDQVMAVNVRGVFLGLRYVIPVMLEQGTGSIINTASVAGMVGSPGMSAYVASKHAVMGLTKTAAGEVSGRGVRVNAVCPGPIDTRMVRDIAAQISPNNPDSVQAGYEASIPQGRYGRAEEVANVVLFLASDLASNVTGTQMPIDGGRTASPRAITENIDD